MALANAGASNVSVMGGTYDSLMLSEIIQKSKTEGYMAELAETVKKNVSLPMITAGRISPAKMA